MHGSAENSFSTILGDDKVIDARLDRFRGEGDSRHGEGLMDP